jgi:hypothetical protein
LKCRSALCLLFLCMLKSRRLSTYNHRSDELLKHYLRLHHPDRLAEPDIPESRRLSSWRTSMSSTIRCLTRARCLHFCATKLPGMCITGFCFFLICHRLSRLLFAPIRTAFCLQASGYGGHNAPLRASRSRR